MVEEQTEQPIDQPKPKRNKKPFIIAGIVAFGVVFIIVAIVLCLCLKTPPKEEPAPSVDFSQQVTNVDGTEFKPTYDAGSDDDLSVRFTDLECNEDCSNISNLKIGTKILKVGEDYEVKRGSVIIVIYKKILQAIQNGQYDITFEIKSGEKTISVGLKITIANSSAPTDEEESENEDERESGDQSQSGSSSQSSSESESSDETEEEKSCSELQNCDYNLNDQYLIKVTTYLFYEHHDCEVESGPSNCLLQKDENGNYYGDIWPVVDSKTYVDIGLFDGLGCGPDGDTTMYQSHTIRGITYGPGHGPHFDGIDYAEMASWKASQYASAHNYDSWPGYGGWGCLAEPGWTWQGIINAGYDLNEEKCATYGLSCGRW